MERFGMPYGPGRKRLEDYVNAVGGMEWIHEDELPEGYPYDEMFPFSRLGADGLGGCRVFPKVFVDICPTCLQPGPRNPKIWAALCSDTWHYPKSEKETK